MTEQSADQNARTLWMGDMAYWMDENYLFNLFSQSGDVSNVKIIRNKVTGVSEGYGFIEFRTHEGAENVLKIYNGIPIPSTEQVFRLNWAAFGVGRGATEDYSVFVGDLAPDVTDYVLQENFRQFFPSVRSAKVITDPLTGKSKGYGFVRFGNEHERDRALTEMNGHYISSRPIRVSLATAKKNQGGGSVAPTTHAGTAPTNDADPTNTTLFIGGLSASVTENDLRSIFGRFGDTVYVKIPQGKGCGFVQYVERSAAERAMAQMHGQVIGNSAVRISWGRSSQNRGQSQGQTPAPAAQAYQYPTNSSSYGMYAPFPTQSYAMYGAANGAATAEAYGYGSYGLNAMPAAQNVANYSGITGVQTTESDNSFYSKTTVGARANSQRVQVSHQQTKDLYDPASQCSVDNLNQSYIQTHQPALVGSHLFA